MSNRRPLFIFILFAAAAIAIAAAGKLGTIGPDSVKRGLGLAIGALAIGIGNYLPKMRPFRADRAERIAGGIFLAVGVAYVALFLFEPVDLARRVASIIGIGSLLVVTVVAVTVGRGARFRGSHTSIALTIAFLYIFVVACIVYLFGRTPWVDWMFAVYWIAYSVLISLTKSRRSDACALDGPRDDHTA